MAGVNRISCFNQNTLKILAAIFMTLDHIGAFIFPDILFFRIVGRLSFPLFAYMIAEGAFYTRNKFKYFIRIFLVGIFCQTITLAVSYEKIFFNILITFSFSVILIYLFEYIKSAILNKSVRFLVIGAAIFALFLISCILLCRYFTFDYGIYGMIAPLFSSVFRKRETDESGAIIKSSNKYLNVALFSIPLIFLSIQNGPIQFFSLFSLIFLFLYSEKRGKYKLKYFFYIFYPLHIGIIALIAIIINR